MDVWRNPFAEELEEEDQSKAPQATSVPAPEWRTSSPPAEKAPSEPAWVLPSSAGPETASWEPSWRPADPPSAGWGAIEHETKETEWAGRSSQDQETPSDVPVPEAQAAAHDDFHAQPAASSLSQAPDDDPWGRTGDPEEDKAQAAPEPDIETAHETPFAVAAASPELSTAHLASESLAASEGFSTFTTSTFVEPISEPSWASTSHAYDSVAPVNDEWGSTWGNKRAQPAVVDVQDEDDEWSRAAAEQKKLQSAIPTEKLDKWLHDLDAMLEEIPDPQKVKKLGDSLYKENWRSAVRELDDIAAQADRALPPLERDMSRSAISSTFITKQTQDCLKETRHNSIAQMSPFSLLTRRENALQWDDAFKLSGASAFSGQITDGQSAVGTTEPTTASMADAGSSIGGNILSFFGKKGPNSGIPTQSAPPKNHNVPPPTSNYGDGGLSQRKPMNPDLNGNAAQSTLDEVEFEVVPGSAISRFFNRFGHPRQGQAETSLSFLEDVESSESAPYSRPDLPPQRLATPPQAPVFPVTTNTPNPMAPPPKPQVAEEDDLWDVFASAPPQNKPPPPAPSRILPPSRVSSASPPTASSPFQSSSSLASRSSRSHTPQSLQTLRKVPVVRMASNASGGTGAKLKPLLPPPSSAGPSRQTTVDLFDVSADEQAIVVNPAPAQTRSNSQQRQSGGQSQLAQVASPNPLSWSTTASASTDDSFGAFVDTPDKAPSRTIQSPSDPFSIFTSEPVKARKHSASSKPAAASGLSANDLSFFEGL